MSVCVCFSSASVDLVLLLLIDPGSVSIQVLFRQIGLLPCLPLSDGICLRDYHVTTEY